jgi:hypothetical protein
MTEFAAYVHCTDWAAEVVRPDADSFVAERNWLVADNNKEQQGCKWRFRFRFRHQE